MKYKHTSSDLRLENEYPKLVRDKIPEIVEKRTGRPTKNRVMKSHAEYNQYLRVKMIEESHELLEAKSKTHIAEELADVMELVDTILAENKLTLKDIRLVQKAKARERGGFGKRILMMERAK
jgi:predicted house-cleaning noncanonical NTP pyrophosphatase (MazG superfamily)